MSAVVNSALAVLARLVLPDGQLWGDAAEPFQWDAAQHMLAKRPKPPYRFETRPRGGSKTSDTAGIAIADLCELAPDRARSYGVAADAEQAALLLDKAAGFVSRLPSLADVLEIQTRRIVHRTKEATLQVVPADEASSYGLTPRMTIADELSVWPSTRKAKGVWAGMVSALPKVRNSRLMVICSAGDPAHWSHKVLVDARRSPAWKVVEVPGPVPWLNEEDLEEQRSLLLPSQYARLHENRWVGGEDRLVTPEALQAAIVLDGPQPAMHGHTYVAACDVGVRVDATAIAICHAEPIARPEPAFYEERTTPPMRIVLDRMIVIRPPKGGEVQLQDVEDVIVAMYQRYRFRKVVFDPWQAIGLAQRLYNRSIPVEEFTFSQASNSKLTATLYHLLSDRLLALPDDEQLIDELANIRLKETAPGLMPKMEHDSNRHNDQTIALAVAAHELIKDPAPPMRITRVQDMRRRGRGRGGASDYDNALRVAEEEARIRAMGDRRYIEEFLNREPTSRFPRR